jgi:hypothetical protein
VEKEAVCSSEMSLNFYRTTRSHIPESIFHTKYTFQDPLLNKLFFMKITKADDILLLAETPTGRISILSETIACYALWTHSVEQ